MTRRREKAASRGSAARVASSLAFLLPRFDEDRRPTRSSVAILNCPRYSEALAQLLFEGLKLFKLGVSGKSVLLKPNLVDYIPGAHINTHTLLVAAAAECLKRLGARSVVVGEGPGHQRDTYLVLYESGLLEQLSRVSIPFIDLNRDCVVKQKLRTDYSGLHEIWLPRTVLEPDFIVSMPKIKTHHWSGVTLSMKNMFGVVPGSVYGWPKNALHWAGIHGSILDINSSLAMPQFAIIDGIFGMEGNGPIQGHAKKSGVVIFSNDLVAADATAARVMKIEPRKVEYLAMAGEFLGNVANESIEQIGEPLEKFQQDFRVIREFQELKSLTG